MIPRVLGLAVALLGPMLLAALDEPPGAPDLTRAVAGQLALVSIGVTVLVVWRRGQRKPLAAMGLCPLRWESIALGVGLSIFYMFVFLPFTAFVFSRFGLSGWDQGVAEIGRFPIWYLVAAVVIAGVVEEILYRGYAIETLKDLTGSYGVAAVVSTVVFGLAHAPGWGWGPAVSATASGALATAVYLWTRDLDALIICHVITDFAGIVVPNL